VGVENHRTLMDLRIYFLSGSGMLKDLMYRVCQLAKIYLCQSREVLVETPGFLVETHGKPGISPLFWRSTWLMLTQYVSMGYILDLQVHNLSLDSAKRVKNSQLEYIRYINKRTSTSIMCLCYTLLQPRNSPTL